MVGSYESAEEPNTYVERVPHPQRISHEESNSIENLFIMDDNYLRHSHLFSHILSMSRYGILAGTPVCLALHSMRS